MPRLFHPVCNHHQVIPAHLGQHHAWRKHRFHLFHQGEQQHLALALLEHARRVLQGFTGDDHQRRSLLASDGLLQHCHQKRFIGELRHREAGGATVQLILLTLDALLVKVVATHQHADLIVMMKARQLKLMAHLVLWGKGVQLPGDTPQRMHDQPVNAPGQRHAEDQCHK